MVFYYYFTTLTGIVKKNRRAENVKRCTLYEEEAAEVCKDHKNRRALLSAYLT